MTIVIGPLWFLTVHIYGCRGALSSSCIPIYQAMLLWLLFMHDDLCFLSWSIYLISSLMLVLSLKDSYIMPEFSPQLVPHWHAGLGSAKSNTDCDRDVWFRDHPFWDISPSQDKGHEWQYVTSLAILRIFIRNRILLCLMRFCSE